jgi:putative Mg2+ transporter-C (MgtC) family protein
MDWTHIADLAGPLLAALIGGGLVGLERGLRSEPAGFRTHALVCVAAAVLVMSLSRAGAAHGDPAAGSRVAQGVVTGVGFLGAGVIMREGLSIHNLTTAASIWAVAALGVVFGYGLYTQGALGVAFLMLVLFGLRYFDKHLLRRQVVAELRVRSDAGRPLEEPALKQMLAASGVSGGLVSSSLKDGVFELAMRITASGAIPADALTDKLRAETAVIGFDLEVRAT